jgi:hypothetical protein
VSDPIFLIGEAPFQSPREIVKGMIYQGGAAEGMGICKSSELLTSLGLKAVITVAHDVRIQVPATLVHLHVPVDEINPTPEKYFDLVCNLGVFPVYIHCMAGANRSRVFAAALAWKCCYMPLEQAIEIADPPPCGIVYESMMKWAKA